MSNIYLIRHAQQIEDFVPIDNWLYEVPLAPIGITQAEHLRDRLAATHEIQADVLISSPLLRARTTAEIIAPALGLPVMLDDDFQEFRTGNRVGIADKDIDEAFSFVDFEREPLRIAAPGGESWQQFITRISGAFDRIAHDYDGKAVVIVTHDGVICASFLYFLGLPSLKFVKGLIRLLSANFIPIRLLSLTGTKVFSATYSHRSQPGRWYATMTMFTCTILGLKHALTGMPSHLYSRGDQRKDLCE